MKSRPPSQAFALLILLCCLSSAWAQPARIIEWVEDAPASDTSKIALGYPVPTPVDTPLPFAGFRSYNGLHARHQDLQLSTPWVHGQVIGNTRSGRPIWVYQLGDADHQTVTGLPEQAMLSNGGIHAREWQSPEVATGIIELLATAESDDHLLDYLRDNANVLVIPVLNVDGFLHTQRTPSLSWMGTDPNDPEYSPRDGRMRRKNMLSADEDFSTQEDHLNGVDLNRNNAPFWASNPNRSSPNLNSIVHHGAAAGSEPEIQALDAAAQLGPVSRLSMYTDLHSYSQVHFWSRNQNTRLARWTDRLLQTFSQHHAAFPARKYYGFNRWSSIPVDSGIGLTEEYFTQTYQVPSWTLEIEPSSEGEGVEYGGYARNGHAGFILPDSEVERVRTQLAETFMIAYYHQSRPPAIRAVRLVDDLTGAVVFDAEWDVFDENNRMLHTFQAQPVQLERDYTAWIAWDKPMRWRTDGEVSVMPGKGSITLFFLADATVNGSSLAADRGEVLWQNTPGDAPGGYLHYRDDALAYPVRFAADDANLALLETSDQATLVTDARDFTGVRGDANPATVAHWENGAWAGYEDVSGDSLTDNGGTDSTITFQIQAEPLEDPFVIEPGTSSAWFDPARSGEGFMLEILADERAVMYWFTYDDEGRQDWYIAEGEIRGNRILFPELIRVSGGEFGPGFDPDKVVRTPVGSASFIWSSCDSGAMKWTLDGSEDTPVRQGRMELVRLSRVMGIDCGLPILAPEIEAGRLSGSWYDPAHSGEGYVLEVLVDRRALVYWFSYDTAGQRRWFFGTGEIDGNTLSFDEMFTSSGARFGAAFDPDAVSLSTWGSLELELGCSEGTARFTPIEAGFPAGELDLDRLTLLDGLNCDSPANN